MSRHSTTPSQGRSLKGQPAIVQKPQIKGKDHSVIAAISPQLGLIYYEIKITEPDEEFISKRKGSKKQKTQPKGVTRDIFGQFIINLFSCPPFVPSSSSSSSSASSPTSFNLVF